MIQEARERAAVEMVRRYEHLLKRTARRYSLDAEDVEDAYQRALEIALTKAPTTDPGELIRWTQTVIKHEALAVRRKRERLLGVSSRPSPDGPDADPMALLPASGGGPAEEVERREDVARAREALRALKPAELRALTLLAEGYSYAEIAGITGFSMTKINRCLAEGRERFRAILGSSESGERCRQLRSLISAFCDGEADGREAAVVREHLRACGHCRATLRAYRTVPRLASALVPVLPASRSLLARLHDALAHFGLRVGAAKHLALCAGLAGTAAVGMATGALPRALGVGVPHSSPSMVERRVSPPKSPRPRPRERAAGRHRTKPGKAQRRPQRSEPRPEVRPAEYEPSVEPAAPEPVAPPSVPEASPPSGSPAGEFGP